MRLRNAILDNTFSGIGHVPKASVLPSLRSRYFRRNEGTTDYATIPSATLAADFDISVEFWMTDANVTTGILGTASGSSANFLAIVNTSSHVRLKLSDGIDLNFFSLLASFSKKNSLRIIRTGTSITATLNGVDETLTGGLVSYEVSRIYAIGAGFYFQGILANLRIYDNGVLVRDYPLDDNTDILRNRAATVGPELVTSIATDAGSSYTGGVLTLVQDAGNEFAQTDASLISGSQYLLNYTVQSSDVTGTLYVYDSVGNDATRQAIPTTVGNHSVLITSLFSDDYRLVIAGGLAGSLIVMDNISIRQADGYGTVINGTADQWALYQQQVAGEWLGPELWGPTTIGTSWTDNIDDSYTKNSNSYGAIGEPTTGLSNVSQAGEYRVFYTMINEVGNMRIYTRNSGDTGNVSIGVVEGVGVFSDVSVTLRGIVFDSNDSIGTTVSSISVKEVLNVA